MLSAKSASVNERWFRKNKKDNKYYFEVLAQNNRNQGIGKSPLYDTYAECDEKLIEFIQSIIDHTYKIEITVSLEQKKKYHCSFVGEKKDILFISTGYNCPSYAKKREKKCVKLLKKVFDKNTQRRILKEKQKGRRK